MLKEEEAEKIKIEKETAEAIVKAEMEKVRLIAAQKQKEIDLQLSEQRLMYYEDIVQYELRSRYKEHKSMEYEDILSYMIEYNIMVEEKRINQRLNELEDLYMPFTPNRHKGLNDHGKYILFFSSSSIMTSFSFIIKFKIIMLIIEF